MGDEFEPIETDVKDALEKTAQDVEEGYPKHVAEVAERGETVVVKGTKEADEASAATLQKAMPQEAEQTLRNAESANVGVEGGGRISQIPASPRRVRSMSTASVSLCRFRWRARRDQAP